MNAQKSAASIKDLNAKQLEVLKARLAASEAKYGDLAEDDLDAAEEALRRRAGAVAAKRATPVGGAWVQRLRPHAPAAFGLLAACVLGIVMWPALKVSNSQTEAPSLKGVGASAVCSFQLHDGAGNSLELSGTESLPALVAGQTYLVLGRCNRDGYLQLKISTGDGSDAKAFRNTPMKPTATRRPLTDANGNVVGFTVPSGEGKIVAAWKLSSEPQDETAPFPSEESQNSGIFTFRFAGSR